MPAPDEVEPAGAIGVTEDRCYRRGVAIPLGLLQAVNMMFICRYSFAGGGLITAWQYKETTRQERRSVHHESTDVSSNVFVMASRIVVW